MAKLQVLNSHKTQGPPAMDRTAAENIKWYFKQAVTI